MKLLTVGFIFDQSLESVLLVHKQKPDWQIGKLNGVGGKVEDNETGLTCIARECFEETTLNLPASVWHQYATAVHETNTEEKKQIDFFTAIYSGQKSDAKKGDYEEVEWFASDHLPDNILPNLSFLIPMARYKLQGHNVGEVVIRY